MGDRDRIDAIAAAILEHLRRFPDARDTARGVHDWWLAPDLRGASLAALPRQPMLAFYNISDMLILKATRRP